MGMKENDGFEEPWEDNEINTTYLAVSSLAQ